MSSGDDPGLVVDAIFCIVVVGYLCRFVGYIYHVKNIMVLMVVNCQLFLDSLRMYFNACKSKLNTTQL